MNLTELRRSYALMASKSGAKEMSLYYHDSTDLKHLMAVMVEMKDAKNAAAVVREVTHIVSKEWLRAKWTMLSSCSSRDSKLGSNLL